MITKMDRVTATKVRNGCIVAANAVVVVVGIVCTGDVDYVDDDDDDDDDEVVVVVVLVLDIVGVIAIVIVIVIHCHCH